MAPFASLWLTALLAALSSAAPPLFDSERDQLTDSCLDGISSSLRSLFVTESAQAPRRSFSRCKVFPGDLLWPRPEVWTALDILTDRRLLKPLPQARVCYDGPDYNGTKCAELTAVWSRSYTHLTDPIEMMTPTAQGMTCLPPNVFDSHNCTQGGFPVYVINATTPKHVQLGVNFARNTGVRLVVRNTGHDFLGKSGGRGALSIWTHHFKDIKYIPQYEDKKLGYSGPAFKAGAGVQAFEMYKFAQQYNKTVVGGEGEVRADRHLLSHDNNRS
jgi:hypothetical protein